ncbi:MAG: hypothetical protein CMP56_02195 [Flavobacteriales bacterium]|nr:hypothetical protein [Flavobacteriales bacterium]|tara:strand:+ start:106 stop:657 length:552 start_codon:yes stop_codon:yes gene_type:complete
MSLGNIFDRSIVKEIGQNYGQEISNKLSYDSTHNGKWLGYDTGGKKYKNQLEQICKTWTIKGPTATFNVAQNMYKCFFDLVEEAQSTRKFDIRELLDLMENFNTIHPELTKVHQALVQLNKEELAKKVDEMDSSIFEFFVAINENLTLLPEPTGWFIAKKKKKWELHKQIKDNLQEWANTYHS